MREQVEQHVAAVKALADQLDLVERIAGCIIDAFEKGHRLYLFGNGGSAADAQHIVAELVGRFKRDRRALPAVALTTDTSALTAIANDFAFDQVFARQIEALVTAGDIVWALSVSGRSPNVLRALDAARARGALVIGFTGRAGGALRERCDLTLSAEHESSDRVQEVHQLAYHLICERVENHFAAGA